MKMTRLIDADALKEGIAELKRSPWYNNETIPSIHAGIKEAVEVVELLCIDKAPTVDAVPVIRCKDCKHSSISATFEPRLGEIEPAGYICRLHREPTQGNGFCHKAMPKRKGKENQ